MEVRPLDSSGFSGQSDYFASLNRLSLLDAEAGQVSEERIEPQAVIEDDCIARKIKVFGQNDSPGGRRVQRSSVDALRSTPACTLRGCPCRTLRFPKLLTRPEHDGTLLVFSRLP